MSYLLDRKVKRKRYFHGALLLVLLLIMFYFRSSILGGLSYASEIMFHPVLVLGNSVGGKLQNIANYFASKNSLSLEIENLKLKISEEEGRLADHETLSAENLSLKETLGRKNPKIEMTLAAILAKPNLSPYDTLLIDLGTKEGAQVGDMVFASGNVPIGKIAEVYPDSSKVILFSTSGEKTQVVIGKNIFLEVVGRGGGNFEMILPRNFTPAKGDEVVMPGLTPYVIAIVNTIISDPRDPFTKALLVSPINIQELKFVQVER